jgi:hypothetical protein
MHDMEVSFPAKDKNSIAVEIYVSLTSVHSFYLLLLFLNNSDQFPYVTNTQTRVTPVQILTGAFIICYAGFVTYNFLSFGPYSCLYSIERYVEADI